LDDVTFPELFFGLVGPIGVNMNDVQASLKSALKHVGYESQLVHVTEVLKGAEEQLIGPNSGTVYGQKIKTANSFCRTAKNGAALAGLAISEIRKLRRAKFESTEGTEGTEGDTYPAIPKQAYIIRQLKRSDEIQLLRNLYGDKFIQISVSVEKDSRVQNLVTTLSRDHPDMKQHECEAEARRLIEVDEHEEDEDFGQQVGDIFHLGDFFVDAGDKTKLAAKSLHFIRALFGDNSKTPNQDEFGAFMAASASLRTADLSRQVGAAITTKFGDIISVGCNEVPKAGGGNYWIHDDPIDRDIERGTEQNSIEKQRIIVDFLKQLSKVGFVSVQESFGSPEMKEKLGAAIDDALISDITEYGRMTHAEMTAICDAARLGRALQGTTIYVTTFPCHNCAKHIVASGIDRVVYVEPYPKSKATSSHTDAISIDGTPNGKVSFEHFEGIAPTRYRDLFQKGKRRRGNNVLEWYEGEPRPRIAQRDNLHVEREGVAAHSVLKGLNTPQEAEGP
tara:strand:- start:399 stop:1916 length:1518 start_codon:yes stop_codon:yes gene_type:complete